MSTLYNEIEPFAADWLNGLMKEGRIANGHVERRSIAELTGADLAGYERVHLFAGIGGWDLALRLAGWPDDRPVWTGSCPCQPFSQAGRRRGVEDERHLWPVWRPLIAELRPPTIFGEQVASEDGRLWLARVRADLEAMGYAVGAADLCAAGVGGPHIRQRLYWVAIAKGHGADSLRSRQSRGSSPEGKREVGKPDGERVRVDDGRGGDARGLANSTSPRPSRPDESRDPRQTEGSRSRRFKSERDRAGGRLGNTAGARLQRSRRQSEEAGEGNLGFLGRPGGDGFWDEAAWIACGDGKARRLEPGLMPLAHGVPSRVGLIRGYGNAIVPPLAAVFVRSVMEVIG